MRKWQVTGLASVIVRHKTQVISGCYMMGECVLALNASQGWCKIELRARHSDVRFLVNNITHSHDSHIFSCGLLFTWYSLVVVGFGLMMFRTLFITANIVAITLRFEAVRPIALKQRSEMKPAKTKTTTRISTQLGNHRSGHKHACIQRFLKSHKELIRVPIVSISLHKM